jgi:putative DNA primase/helicase
MTVKISDDLMTETETAQLALGGSVHDLTKTRAPEELALPPNAELIRANGEPITGARWMLERAEMRTELAAAGCKDGKGRAVVNRTFLHIVLTRHPFWRGGIRLNELVNTIECGGERIDDTFVIRVILWFEQQWRMTGCKKGDILDAVEYVANAQRYHPVREYLSSLCWDGNPRVENIVAHLGARVEHWTLYQAYLRAWFTGAVKRAFEPGCKFDYMLVFKGDQGHRKSSFWRALAAPWFNETPLNIEKTSDYSRVHSAWIHEFAELDGFTTKADEVKLKAFVSVQEDSFRRAYGRYDTVAKRSCAFVGTVNKEWFLKDTTGNRRYWVIDCDKRIDLEWVREVRDQIWAEAVAMYHEGEHCWLDQGNELAAAENVQSYVPPDPWVAKISNYVDRQKAMAGLLVAIRAEDCLNEVHPTTERQKKEDIDRVAAILKQLGLVNSRRNIQGQGRPRVWVIPEK